MAVDLMYRAAIAGLAAAAALFAGPVPAMGPAAPFTPPKPEEIQSAVSERQEDMPGLSGLRLNNHPMALIDGQWTRVGDSVRSARVDAIDPTGAVLRYPDGRTERLSWTLRKTRP